MDWRYLIVFILILVLFPGVSASDAPNVILTSPGNGSVQITSNFTLACNVTDDENVFNVSLFTSISGSFMQYDTDRVMEIDSDSDTLLMCHFNGTYVCEDGEAGTNTSTDFVQGRFMQGVRINNSDTLIYPTSSNIVYNKGTIEFWLRTGFNASSDTAWLFSTGSSGANEIQIKVENGNLSFEFRDYSATTRASRNVSGWQENEWHFLTAIWDIYSYVGSGEIVDLFLDGSNESVIYQADYYGYGDFGASMYLGSYGDGTSQTNSTFDEFRISDRARSTTEINASYLKGTGNHTLESVNWSLSGISDGIYIWNCLAYDNESQSSWNNTNYTFTVDTSPPVVNSIDLTPSSAQDIDPGVNVSVTTDITDLTNVSTVILQYKAPLAGLFTNDSMDYNSSSGLWVNGTIVTTGQDVGNWTYRLWFNDTNGFSNTSQDSILQVEWDDTWDLEVFNASGGQSDDFETVSGFKGTGKNLGMLIITNTGDYVMNFDLEHSPWTVPINYNVTEPFDLSSGSEIHIEVNATMPETPNEYEVDINITSSGAPEYREVNATVISYIGGPYINETTEITDYPVSINQSSSANFTARVKNIGNETATNVWLNWTLPSGWTNQSGDLTNFIGNLNSYETSTVTVTLYASSSASSGAATVRINSSCSEGSAGSDFNTVAVNCNSNDGVCGQGCSHSTDSDCESGDKGDTGGGTTVIGGGSAKSEYELVLDAPPRIDINRGEEKGFYVFVEYNHTFTMDGLILEVSGYPQTYISVSPDVHDMVNRGDRPGFEVEIKAPPYIRVGQYDLEIEASGRGSVVKTTLSGSESVVIFVHSTGNESDLFEQAREEALRMAEAGFSGKEMLEMVERMDSLTDNWDYDTAKGVAESIISTAALAFKVNDTLGYIESIISEARSYGFGVYETQKLHELAGAAFQRGDYERADERANNALLSVSVETLGVLPLVVLVRVHWLEILITLSVTGLVGFGLKRRASLRKLRKKMKELGVEERGIGGLMLRLQKDYFSRNRISMDSYSRTMQDYESRLADIKILKARMNVQATGPKGLAKMLKKEREEIIRFMKETQTRYFGKRSVGKDLYNITIKRMREELADIEKSLDMLSGKKRKGSAGFATACIFLLLVLAAVAAAQTGQEAVLQEMERAEQAISEMLEAGFGTSHANDTLNEAGIMFSRGEYAAAEALSRKVWDIRDAAFEADHLIDEAEERIYLASQEVDVSGASGVLQEGIALFRSENYLESTEMLREAIQVVEALQSEAALEKSARSSPVEQIAAGLREYWYAAISFAAIAAVVLIIINRHKRLAALKKRLHYLERERASLENMMKKLQGRYFNKRIISKVDYDTIMERYRKRIVLLEKDLYTLKQKV